MWTMDGHQIKDGVLIAFSESRSSINRDCWRGRRKAVAFSRQKHMKYSLKSKLEFFLFTVSSVRRDVFPFSSVVSQIFFYFSTTINLFSKENNQEDQTKCQSFSNCCEAKRDALASPHTRQARKKPKGFSVPLLFERTHRKRRRRNLL